jgi:hypothetical protein
LLILQICAFNDRKLTYWLDFVLSYACMTEHFVFLGTVLNLAFALSVLGFLIMHISLVAGNTTTIEVFWATNPFPYCH